MRIIFSFLALAFLFTSCNDGDIITVELDFGDTFSTTDCIDKLICHKIKTDPSESLSVVIDTSFEDLIETEPDTTNPLLVNLVNNNPSFTISSSNPFNYRTYSNAITSSVFCSAIPPSNLGVTNDYNSDEGESTFIIILTEDDNDGIPAEMEDDNNDGDDDPETDPTDTDGDGLPNYLDADDDGDNVLTATELVDFSDLDTDGDLLTNPEDTDGDGIPNYLDNDDDGDGILTINEDIDETLNPADDIQDSSVGPDYLNAAVQNTFTTTTYREHTITQSFQLSLDVTNISTTILTQDFIAFGTLTETDSRDVTPTF